PARPARRGPAGHGLARGPQRARQRLSRTPKMTAQENNSKKFTHLSLQAPGYPACRVEREVVPVGARNWGGGGWRAGHLKRPERARDEGTGGGRRRRRWSLPANATRTRTRRRGGRRRRWSARCRRSAGSPRGG